MVCERPLAALVVALALLSATACVEREPYRRPSTESERQEGDLLAKKMQDALGGRAAWDAVAFVDFSFVATFAGFEAANRRHQWDKGRGFLVTTTGEGKERVALDLWDKGGFATDDEGRALTGEALADRLEDAWAHFINDSYWLCAPFKVFDDGAVRAAVDGKLRITFEKAVGLTPGDAYLYTLDENGRPTQWSFLLESGISGTFLFTEETTQEGVTLFGRKQTEGGQGPSFPGLLLSRAAPDETFRDLLDRRGAR